MFPSEGTKWDYAQSYAQLKDYKMKSLYFLILFLLLGACNLKDDYDFEYDIIVRDYATNLKDLNSAYDDYNSDLPYPGRRIEIYFSSNRRSRGVDFDFVGGLMDFSYHKKDDVLDIHVPKTATARSIPEIILKESINTADDEFGPHTYRSAAHEDLFMYATGKQGDFKIKFVEIPQTGYYTPEEETVTAPEPVTLAKINDIGDNLYPSIGEDKKELFFCSNRNDDVFNIYSARYNTEITKESLAAGDIANIEKVAALSSPYDDKCPYIQGNIMVFASNRPGGYGGYDLWYSLFQDNEWSSPVNFGDKINSEHDEFRPVLSQAFPADLNQHNVMIFSSNRPGGKGGFDLYIARMREFDR